MGVFDTPPTIHTLSPFSPASIARLSPRALLAFPREHRSPFPPSDAEFRVFVVEAQTYAEHQIIRGIKVLEAVSDVEKSVAGGFDFKRKDLVECFDILSCMVHIGSKSYVDREDGHDKLGSSG